eukprot:tig00020903_g15099.t1
MLSASARAGLARSLSLTHMRISSRCVSDAVKMRKPWEVVRDAPPIPPPPPPPPARMPSRDNRDFRRGFGDREGNRRPHNRIHEYAREEGEETTEAEGARRRQFNEWQQKQEETAKRKAKAARITSRAPGKETEDSASVSKPSEKRVVELTAGRKSVQELSALFGVPIKRLSRTLQYLGYWNSSKSVREIGLLSLNVEQIELVAADLGVETIRKFEELDPKKKKEKDATRAGLPPRAPIVTIMGHVDHGKTSLLDALRKTSVAAGEAGGITQHLGAFQVVMPSGPRITFLDTPGHAAFQSIRARGAQVTDVVVLVVAADDGVMPQTVEAIRHAQAARVAIVVAINKCDVPDANPRKVREQLLSYNIVCEEYGGDALCVEISAKQARNLDKLEEAILLQAEMLDIRASNSGSAEATILETRMDKHYGVVASAIVREGRLAPGDYIVAGNQFGRVRLLLDDQGRPLDEALPAQPCMIVGLKGSPQAGDEVLVVENEDQAEEVCAYRSDLMKQRELETTKFIMAAKEEDEVDQYGNKVNKKRARFLRRQAEMAKKAEQRAQHNVGDAHEVEEEDAYLPQVAVVIKADVTGSMEAIIHMLSLWPTDEVEVIVVGSGLGEVNASDLQTAAALKADVYAFNVGISPSIAEAARQMGIKCKDFNIIYRLLEDIRDNASALLPAKYEMEPLSRAEVAQIFKMKQS